ncbi:hypothetical protein E2C01_048051 [Portunus trituberculatus]|uniref:Uncharacterized protein n=1 Tax=Portunus trituberculatus TaxID=210409 RepID=A0A5B7GC70_PORTR|nr:hypothetical protein [Portunus trituberculatus]
MEPPSNTLTHTIKHEAYLPDDLQKAPMNKLINAMILRISNICYSIGKGGRSKNSSYLFYYCCYYCYYYYYHYGNNSSNKNNNNNSNKNNNDLTITSHGPKPRDSAGGVLV